MPRHYSDPKRATNPHALPDVETFYAERGELGEYDDDHEPRPGGWYYWSCFPGCLPDSDPVGPFDTEADALADARQSVEE